MHYELMLAARVLLDTQFGPAYSISYENVPFVPPSDGSMWLKFDYMEAETRFLSLDRKCKSYIGIVQVAVIFSPGDGTDAARRAASDIAKFFYDGRMLQHGYIYQGAEVRPVQKHETGYMIPVRFTVRFDEKQE